MHVGAFSAVFMAERPRCSLSNVETEIAVGLEEDMQKKHSTCSLGSMHFTGVTERRLVTQYTQCRILKICSTRDQLRQSRPYDQQVTSMHSNPSLEASQSVNHVSYSGATKWHWVSGAYMCRSISRRMNTNQTEVAQARY